VVPDDPVLVELVPVLVPVPVDVPLLEVVAVVVPLVELVVELVPVVVPVEVAVLLVLPAVDAVVAVPEVLVLGATLEVEQPLARRMRAPAANSCPRMNPSARVRVAVASKPWFCVTTVPRSPPGIQRRG
jgi:hypothetical protein